jgi:hypothetical protein
MYDCATWEEIDFEWEQGKKRFRELLDNMKDRQQNGDFRMGYSGLREIIEGLELNEFILENSEEMGA